VIENLFHQIPVYPESVVLVVRIVKTNHWAMAVNVKSEDVKNLTFTVSSAAAAALWGQWSKSALIYAAASYDYYVVLSGRCTTSSNQSGCRSNPLHPPHRLTPPLGYFGKSSFGPTVPDPPYLTGLPRRSSIRRRLGG
jgi:hypothetical protein